MWKWCMKTTISYHFINTLKISYVGKSKVWFQHSGVLHIIPFIHLAILLQSPKCPRVHSILSLLFLISAPWILVQNLSANSRVSQCQRFPGKVAKSLNDLFWTVFPLRCPRPLVGSEEPGSQFWGYLLTVHLCSNSRARISGFFEFGNSGQSFNNKSFQEVPFPRACLRGGEWAESLLEHRTSTALCAALSAKLKINLLTKSAVNCAVYN